MLLAGVGLFIWMFWQLISAIRCAVEWFIMPSDVVDMVRADHGWLLHLFASHGESNGQLAKDIMALQ